MNVSTPRYMLSCEASRSPDCGQWRFALRAVDGSDVFEASDAEPDVRGERLDLLTVVRALESLDQPSQVTLVGCSPYIRQGIQCGLSEWRQNGWRWEFFGQMVPVKNCDLWQRLDRVMCFHEVDVRLRRFDASHELRGPVGIWRAEPQRRSGQVAIRPAERRRLRSRIASAAGGCGRRVATVTRLWRRRIGGTWKIIASWCTGRTERRDPARG